MTKITNFQEKLAEHRKSIDRLDAILIYTLGERFKQTEKIGKLKAANNLPASDHVRERFQIEKLKKLSEEANLDESFAKKILNLIISEVIINHNKIKSR